MLERTGLLQTLAPYSTQRGSGSQGGGCCIPAEISLKSGVKHKAKSRAHAPQDPLGLIWDQSPTVYFLVFEIHFPVLKPVTGKGARS